MRLHFRSYGSGTPLVILHGLFGSLDNWHSMSQKLSGKFQVLAVDQRNHGQSPHSLEMSYQLMAQDINELLEALHLPAAHVLGHSMGGKTAMQLALAFPQRVQKLIVVDIAPRPYPPHHEQVLAALLSLDLHPGHDRRHLERALAPDIPDLATRQFLLKNLKRNPDGSFRWQLGLGEIQRNYRRLSEGITAGAAFNGPALFLRGEESDYVADADGDSIRALFPRAELQTIARAGHLPHVENPRAFLEAVNTFLSPH